LGDAINKFLLIICKKPYPVECFAINFGRWKSESSKDENVVECHGHFHLHITKEIVDKMEQKKDSNGYAVYPAMHGKVNDPIQYGMKNCKKLETSRLSGLEIVGINQELVDLNRKLDEMDKKFNEMNKKLTTFMESFSSLKKENGSVVNN
jgi:predicted metal-binding protein